MFLRTPDGTVLVAHDNGKFHCSIWPAGTKIKDAKISHGFFTGNWIVFSMPDNHGKMHKHQFVVDQVIMQ